MSGSRTVLNQKKKADSSYVIINLVVLPKDIHKSCPACVLTSFIGCRSAWSGRFSWNEAAHDSLFPRISLDRHLRSLMDVASRHRLEQETIKVDRSSMLSFNYLVTKGDELISYSFDKPDRSWSVQAKHESAASMCVPKMTGASSNCQAVPKGN